MTKEYPIWRGRSRNKEHYKPIHKTIVVYRLRCLAAMEENPYYKEKLEKKADRFDSGPDLVSPYQEEDEYLCDWYQWAQTKTAPKPRYDYRFRESIRWSEHCRRLETGQILLELYNPEIIDLTINHCGLTSKEWKSLKRYVCYPTAVPKYYRVPDMYAGELTRDFYKQLQLEFLKLCLSYDPEKGIFSTYIHQGLTSLAPSLYSLLKWGHIKRKPIDKPKPIERIELGVLHKLVKEIPMLMRRHLKSDQIDIVTKLADGMTQEEVAKECGVTQQDISKRLMVIRKRLLRNLGENYSEKLSA